MQDYRKLIVWQKARQLTVAVYEATETFPRSERFGLQAQTRRSVVSISSNIAEGCGRNTTNELLRFIGIATGSAHELESQMTLAHDLRFIEADVAIGLLSQLDEVKAMLTGLRKAVAGSDD